ncbi:protein suppressor 2 of zeste [Lucilia cuprina]|uniref:protein suppressor 2 of zeste n=1 Tax=Lucilia cuprina TaxID=7375 RepID=UPI001F051986|nr:protein suppressor 2 of zeste [Lucilia cuprina]XP_046810219.1 protein suppressor 2 of zeste [Lucilia cuprina]XP_046810220.1 protein suppressor 2 of zeste [Lucilia cuprina]XP_046810221.1 protein suppressor 2 of zeste [Lucilia cuprina]XP_046810222.1 protein suppressor 2 of zeste [Lucilia cuprina]XP_046810223.1 protein suppressor 2 of zeste [Lucilia cuprina]
MQLIEDECQNSTQQQTVTTQVKQQTSSATQHKMDKFYPPKPKINAFNELFTCYLCQGYMINPTTIDVCAHTYCRSCIARHLAVECYCPQCGKPITTTNLQSDDVLRSIIYKLVPGLYQKERERLVQFVNNKKNEGKLIGSTEQSLNELLESDDELFSPTDPISLSLEFHPVLAEQCPEGTVPPVRYLQCPASVKVQHLKRFLCSKFEIDPCNRRVGIDIIYEDEVLPSDFTLMDVGYCYKWQRHAPLKLTYRILIYDEDTNLTSDNSFVSEDKILDKSPKSCLDKSPSATLNASKTVSFADNARQITVNGDKEQAKASILSSPTTSSPPQLTKVKSSKSSSNKHSTSHATSSSLEVPVKVTISRKPTESKKSVSKKSSSADDFAMPTTTSDFKSLRSNDIRFCDYAITSSTTNTSYSNSHNTLANNSVQTTKKEKPLAIKEEKPAKCDIVVSIPHNQMQEEWESKPLSQLKTASKKSPNSSAIEVAPPPTKKVRNVPKLKIELNSLKTKLIEKPKSADIRLDTLMLKQHRPRKFSLDEPQPVVDKVDLETYVKQIGLKPIEVQTTSTLETPDKFTPNASPMSSSSSTTSSSTGNFNFNCSADITSSSSSSSHKKRKKKHSKDSRESKDSKRKKMHAEISSHSAEESLKMKVKLTPSINLKSLKLESKKSPPFNMERVADPLAFEKPKSPSSKIERNDFEKSKSPEGKSHERSKEKSKPRSSESKKSKSLDSKSSQDSKKLKDFAKSKPLEIKISLSNTTSKPLSKEFDDDEDLIIPDSTSFGLSKSLSSIKETTLPHSPPLPPSLFKTTPLTFSTFSPNVTTVAKPKPVAMPKDSKDKPKTPHMKPIAPKPIAAKPVTPPSSTTSFKTPHFVVPNPPRFMASNTTKFLSTPTSIASAANKHMGNLLKRSISLDDNKNSGPLNKQQRLEKPNQITVSAYGSNLHMTKVEIPATPTSSTAKATYEIPLYSPLSASYNPKCSFSVNSTTAAAKSTTKSTLQNPMTSSASPVPTAKHTFTANTASTNKTDMEVKKATTNDIKPSAATANNNNKTKPTLTTSMTTLMGPPMPMHKLNSSLTVVPTAVKSPPLSTVLPFASTSSSSSSSSLNLTPTAQQHTPVLNTAYLSSPLSMVNYRQSKVLLAHVKPTNLPEMKIEKTTSTTTAVAAAAATTTVAATATATTKTPVATTNGLATEKAKSSLRQFRLPSRDSGQDILDLSASTKTSTNGVTEKQAFKTTTTPIPTNTTTATTSGSTLEMALNKIKQNMTSTTTTANSSNNNSANAIDHVIKKQELLSPISDDLQNLHLLSESATAREKIAISTSTTTSSSSTSLYEKAKITQNSLVRQQNASVRNIPNPSALAFRNQQPATIIPPMVTIAAGLATSLTDLDKPLLLKTPSPPKSPHSPNCSTSSTSPSRNASKKHPSIDQVAASLNQRASAAAEAKAKHTDETSLVTSTSSSLSDKLESKKEIKQETTETPAQSEAASAAQPSSTVGSCPLSVNVLDIKKEPEEKMEEVSEIKPAFMNASTKKSSMIENLVTSVINVSTSTSTLLTAGTAAGF